MKQDMSVIVPIYNPGPKLERCLTSIDALRDLMDIQVVFVDDCSSDGSYGKILDFSSQRDWATTKRLSHNSGSPSEPRNIGLTLATGDYVIYLDADDELLPEGVVAALDRARLTGADFVRAPLIRRDDSGDRVMNVIESWKKARTRSARAEAIVRFHSTTPTAVYSREFLTANSLTWCTDLHMAEDAVFLYEALAVGDVEYSNEPLYIYDASTVRGQISATQRYGDAEMLNHVEAWSRSQQILMELGIDYFAVRGQVALQSAIQSMVEINRSGFSRSAFRLLGNLLRSYPVVAEYTYRDRYSEIRDFILADRYEEFLQSIKPRMVIAGHDMKFIRPATPLLERQYNIRFDDWADHDEHDESRSIELLTWADVIFCEWMLGNAVWYSEHKLPHQRLSIRVHRFELNRNYGLHVVVENVDQFVVIAPALMDELQLSFGIPRTKIEYHPNYLAINEYVQGDDGDRVYRLAMVGVVPKLKGLHRALRLLADLRKKDPKYTLTLLGKHPSDLPWVANDSDEMAYYRECQRYIEDHDLGEAVDFAGWVNPKRELANFGIVLSLSDIEGSHVSATEIFFAGGIGVLRPWPGASFVYPAEFILPDHESMVEFVLSCRNLRKFESIQAGGKAALLQLYGHASGESR